MAQDDLLGRVDALLAGLNERYSIESRVADLVAPDAKIGIELNSGNAPTRHGEYSTSESANSESQETWMTDDLFESSDLEEFPLDSEENSGVDLNFFWYSFQQGLPKLDQDRQIELARAIEAGVLARGALDGHLIKLDHWDDSALALLVADGEKAREEMILGNLPLVMHWARRSSSAGMRYPIEDRFQDGVFGLMRAIEKWDYLRGYTFSTYATWDIRQQISRHTDDNAYLIRVPIHTQEKWKSARKSGTTESNQYEDARRLVMGILSWEMVIELEYEEVISEEDDHLLWAIDEIAEEQVLQQLLSRLPPESSGILRARSGIGVGEPRTLDSIGTEMGITRERVRQIEAKSTNAAGLAYWSSVLPFLEIAMDLAREGWPDGDSYVGALCLDPTSTPYQILNDMSSPRELRRYKKLLLVELAELLDGLVEIFNDLSGPFEAPPMIEEIREQLTVRGITQRSRTKAHPVAED